MNSDQISKDNLRCVDCGDYPHISAQKIPGGHLNMRIGCLNNQCAHSFSVAIDASVICDDNIRLSLNVLRDRWSEKNHKHISILVDNI